MALKKTLQKAQAPVKAKPLTPAQRKAVSTLDGQGVTISGKKTNYLPFPDEMKRSK